MSALKIGSPSSMLAAFSLSLVHLVSCGHAANAGSPAEVAASPQNARLGLIPVPWPRKSIVAAVRPMTPPQQAAKRPHTGHKAPSKVVKLKIAPTDLAEPVKSAAQPVEPVPDRAVVSVPPPIVPSPPPPVTAKMLATLPPSAPTAADNARARAADLLLDGQILAARRVLSNKAIANDPAVITTLGQTFDPLVLETFPNLKGAADRARARALYVRAISRGNTDAQQRLLALDATRHK